MPEAVIVDAVRSPDRTRLQGIARAAPPRRDGGLRGRPASRAKPRRRPRPRGGRLLRLRHAAGPPGIQHRPDHRPALREALQETNGVTISRYCASSLDAIRHAANAVKAGEGDAYIAAGVEWVSRYNERTEPAGAADQNEKLQGKDGTPNAYIEMGLTAVNVANRYEVSRADMDKYAQRSQELAVASQESGYFDREIVPVGRPRGQRGREGRRTARELDPREARRASRGVRAAAASPRATPAR